MIDGAEEYRVEPGSRRNAGDQTNIFPVDGSRRSESSRDEFMLKIASRWQSVNQWKSTTTATSSEDSGSTELYASSWDNIASTAIPTSLASFAQLELNLWTGILIYIYINSASLIVTLVYINCLLINILYVTIRLMFTNNAKHNSVWTSTVFDNVLLSQFGFDWVD